MSIFQQAQIVMKPLWVDLDGPYGRDRLIFDMDATEFELGTKRVIILTVSLFL